MKLTKQESNLVRWIEALISGKYHKLVVTGSMDHGQLYDPKSKCYCALGVAAKVMRVPHIGSWFFFFGPDWAENMEHSKLYIPRVWFRKTFGPWVDPDQISAMSDGCNTFAEIALALTAFLPRTFSRREEWFWNLIDLQNRCTDLIHEERAREALLGHST